MIVWNSCSYTLNYLIYLQNIYLNTTQQTNKFPYVDSSQWRVDLENFAERWQAAWQDTVATFSKQKINERREPLFDENTNHAFQEFFQTHAGFQESVKSFMAWWNSDYFGGRYNIDRLTDEVVPVVYQTLKNDRLSQDQPIPESSLCLEFVYDLLVLSTIDLHPNHVVIPIGEIMPYKHTGSIPDRVFGKLLAALE